MRKILMTCLVVFSVFLISGCSTSDLTKFDLSDLRKEDENLGLLWQALYEIDDKVK